MEPIFLSVMVSDLERGGLKLIPIANPSHPDSDLVKRHFFHDGIVMTNKEGGTWKIRSGLAAVIAVYPQIRGEIAALVRPFRLSSAPNPERQRRIG
jgi:hypothetical protein